MLLKKLLLFCVFSFCVFSNKAFAQNINGEKIQVATDALTVLKFNSEIKRYELGDRKGYTCQVRDYDNSIVVKTLETDPQPTNLLVTEGKRTHYFIITFLPKIDINNTKLFYDYSDLKLVKRIVENSKQPEVAANTQKSEAIPKVEKETAKERKKKEKEQEKVLEEERRKAADLEKERIAAQNKEAEKAKQLAAAEQAKKDAALNEKQIALAEKKKSEQEKTAAAERKKQELLEKEQDKTQKEKERLEQLAAAKEAERKKKSEEEQYRIQKINDEKEAAVARQKEDVRIAAEKKKQIAEEKEADRVKSEQEKKLAALKEKQRKEEEQRLRLAKQEEEKRVKEEAERIKKEAEANKTEYTQAELWKKYPNILFGDLPEGQHMTGEYFLPADTAENYRVSSMLLAMPPWLSIGSDTVNGVSMVLQSMIFSGVNCYMRFTIYNKTKKDLLIGNMNLHWEKESGNAIDLFPCYVNAYPVILPGKDFTLMYTSRAVNAGNNDKFIFTLADRLKKTYLKLPISGAAYNLEMAR